MLYGRSSHLGLSGRSHGCFRPQPTCTRFTWVWGRGAAALNRAVRLRCREGPLGVSPLLSSPDHTSRAPQEHPASVGFSLARQLLILHERRSRIAARGSHCSFLSFFWRSGTISWIVSLSFANMDALDSSMRCDGDHNGRKVNCFPDAGRREFLEAAKPNVRATWRACELHTTWRPYWPLLPPLLALNIAGARIPARTPTPAEPPSHAPGPPSLLTPPLATPWSCCQQVPCLLSDIQCHGCPHPRETGLI